MSSPQPSRVWRTVLSCVVHPADRRFAVDDLADGFERRSAESGAAAARSWYRQQVLRSLVPALGNRWARRPRMLAALVQDSPYALRSLAKTPVVTAVVVISLAVGIGSTTAVFSAANAFLLRPPSAAIAEPERLATVFTSDNSGGAYGRNSVLDTQAVREAVDAFDGLATHRLGIVEVEGPDWVRSTMIEIVSGNYFDVLGVDFPVGRGFEPEETAFGRAERLVVISAGLWEERFGADPGVIGENVLLDGDPFTVIGIAPADLSSRFLALQIDAWVPLGIPGGVFVSTETEWNNRGNRDHGLVGRLADGVTMQQAEAQLAVVADRLVAEYPADWEDHTGRPRRFSVLDERAARVPPDAFAALTAVSTVFVLAAGLVLAVACFNVAGIMLARADARRQEIAVRLALGARPRRIAGLLLLESLLLAVVASGLGILFAHWLIVSFDSVSLPIANFTLRFDVGIDQRVLGFALVTAVLTSVAFGMVPALRGARPDLVPALKGLRTAVGGARRRIDFRNLLVVGQVAVAMIFVVGSGTTLRSFDELVSLDWGVEVEGLAVMTKEVDSTTSAAERVAEYSALLDDIRARPDIADTQMASSVEGTSFAAGRSGQVRPDGYEPAPGEDLRVPYNAVTPGYFELLQIRLLAGRTVSITDSADAGRVAIVNESFAERFWPGESPLGRRFRIGRMTDEGGDLMTDNDPNVYTVVGLAADARYEGFEGAEAEFFWTALLQNPPARAMLVARAHGGVERAVTALRESVPADERGIMVIPPGRLEDLRDFQFAFLKVMARFLGSAGAFGLLLAAMGIYGTVAFTVSRRSREMAIRQAVGALQKQVIAQVFRTGLRLGAVGLAVGATLVVPLIAYLRSDLHGVAPLEPLGLVVGGALVLGATSLASYLPARRVTRVAPVETLRAD